MLYAAVITAAVCLSSIPVSRGFKESGWAEWSKWTHCSVTCGHGTVVKVSHWAENGVRIQNKTKQRYDTCYIDKECPVNGNWTTWGPWSWCSSACGPGHRKRERYCGNPYPASGGLECVGKDKQSKSCTRDPCPTLPPDFSMKLCEHRDRVFMCKNNIQCVNLTERCDRKVKCTDGSDEEKCYKFTNGAELPFCGMYIISVTISCLTVIWIARFRMSR